MKKPTRILIVEDTAADAELARHAIRKVLGDCEFKVVETLKDFLQELGAFQPDVVLSDYSLPQFNGLKALQLTLAHAPLTPLIIWTSSISEDVAVDCMKAGANNYVIKENLKRLGPAVIHALEERETLIARRQAEESLKERERQLTMLMSNLPGPVYRCSNDPNYTVEFISDGIKELSGYQAEDFREHRRHLGKMIHPDDQERIWGEIQTAVERNQPFELTYRILTATGEQKWVWEKGQGILDAAGQLQALEGFITDITERKQSQEVLFQSLEQTERSQNLLLRLSDVGRSIQRAHSAKEVYRAICEGMSGLGYHVSILTLREDKRHLTMAHTTLSSKLINAVEKFTGFSIWSYPIPIREDGFLKKIFEKSEAILTIQTEADIARLLPGPLHLLAGKLQSLLNFRRVIGAQIIIGDEPQGVIIVDGPELTEFDTLPITALAAQASVALENAQLYESVQQELSERKEAESKLAKSEERYHYLFENNPHPMWLYDRKTLAFLDVNEAAIAKYKYSSQEFLNMTIADIRPPEDRERLMENLGQDRSVLERSEGWRHRLKDGTIINVEITSHIVEVDQRESVLVVAQDITERIQAEEALRASEIRFRTFVDHATDAFFLHDEDEQGRILDVNRQACEGLGYSREELIGLTPLDFDLDIAPTTIEQRRTRLDAGETLTFDTRHRRKDGTAFPVEVRMRSFKQGGRRFAISLVHDITGRKQAEARINDLLGFNEKILNHSPIGVLTYKLTGECIYANESAASIVGTRVEQLQAQNFHTIKSWKESGLYDLVEKTSKTKAPVTSDIHHVSTFGKDIWMTIHCVAFQSKGEDHVLLFISDITERKRAEEALRESENRLALALSGAQMSVWEWDLRDNHIFWTPKFFEIVGVRENEFDNTFEAFVRLIHSDDAARMVVSIKKAMIEGGSFAEEFRVVHPDGITRWLSSLGHTEYDPTRKYLRMIGTVQDITGRKQAETALMESMAQFRTLFEASPDAILLLDPSNNWSIIDCNTAACQMNGYRREELIGQHIDILNTTPSDPDKWEEHLERMRQQGILRYEINHRRKDGSVFTVEVSNSLIHFGKRDIVLGIDRDITQRKQSEEETRRHMAELEALYKNGLAVGRLLKPAEIGNQVIETFARYLSWHHVAIRLRREESDDLELVAFNLPTLKDEERSAAAQHFIARVNKVGHGLSGWVIQTGAPLRTGNVHAHPQYIRSHASIQSGLYMPLKAGQRVIGVISVESETPNAFTEQDERLLATLANQAAIAFENAWLYETIQKELAERRRAEEALRVSETHYRELANSITDILFELDQDLHCTHWNKASEVVTGIPVERAIGKPIREIFGTTEERIGLEQIYKDVLKDHQPRTFETAIILNGEKHSFDVNVYPSTRGMSVVAKDVTERKRSEIILQKRFELMEYSATHALGELILRTVDEVSDLTGSTIGFFHFVEADQTTLGTQVWSTNALQLHTVPIGEGRHLSLDQAGVWAEAARQRRSLIQNHRASLSERTGLPQGHVPVTREIVMPVIRNERMMAIIGIGNKPQDYNSYDLEIAERLVDYAWDIIERKQMEEVLAKEHDQLAQRVEERTSDLSRANASLARALRVKDEFLANMSHELRTPLNAILGLSESLAEQIAGPLNEKQQKYINTISESGHHLLSLINDILDLAKIESGQITLDINKVDIHSVCQASLRMIKQLAQKKNQEVFLNIDAGLGLMWADERRLKQMIVNLLSNAVKFTPENGKLGLEVHGDEAANKITITVWDHGIGIRDNDLTRLFRPFVQLDSGLAREAPGTGLGLALVAQMARLHGGSVGAVSEPEKGSRFSIILPWEPALAVDSATRLKNTGKFRAIKPDQTNRPTILLVEDTQEVTMMIRDYLELAGYKVVTAQDGVDALVQARLARPSLILMDVQMPRMDGLEATRKLRAEPDFKDTPIIALTALAMSSDRERCLAAGMNEYLSKPIHLKGLVKVIQGFLSSREESQSR